MHDLLITGGTVVDGTGAPRRTADVAVSGGRITDVGRVDGPAKRTVKADGLLVTPGWVDIHTHYDGQASWDPLMTPSSWHGVTTAVMGNCGVGFAPARREQRQWMLELMEGVEDIPGAVLAEGVKWEWETFPEYLQAMARIPRAIDLAAQIPHAAVRVYVMGERGANREPATPDDMRQMAAIVKEAILAGAIGFSTSRTFVHKTSKGQQAPTFDVAAEELITIARAVGETGRGVLQMISDFEDIDAEFEIMRQCAKVSGRPLSFTLLQRDHQPTKWRELLDRVEIARAEGLDIKVQVACRPIGMVHGLECSMHPFFLTPGYQGIAGLPLAERVRRMQDPALRARIIAESRTPPENWRLASITRDFHKYYPLARDHADYEPHPDTSVAALARRTGRSPEDVVYDLLLEDEGTKKFYFPLYNYTGGDLEVVRQMMTHPASLMGLGDAGAHLGYICDASYPTYLITHWARDRTRGPKIPLEQLVHMQTMRNARGVGITDRGALLPGQKADINLIDFEKLSVSAPKMVYDLPAGGRRLVQTAEGYEATLAGGEPIESSGGRVGVLPGKMVN
ncbi:MAG: amidohydrolase family protein [Burkholderiales bacterium]|nr:amidohydrolase family protein [Burkholderiales bacterium]